MNPASTLETVEVAKAEAPVALPPNYHDTKGVQVGDEKVYTPETSHSDDHHDAPTDEELNTLIRVSGKVPWTAYTIAFVELCERFSFYGTTIVFVNYIQQKLPPGSNTGAGFSDQSGALGMGQRASTGLTTFNNFWAYIMPILGAYIADEYLGRFRTIQWAILVALVGHTILIISAIPPVIVHPQSALACFTIGLVIMGVGVGMFKSNISPLIAEQYRETKLRVVTNKKGERQIMDPTITVQRIFMYFYMMINVGSVTGQISMVYAEKYVGFWLSYLLPTSMFLLCPIVLFSCRKKYVTTPPAGSTLGNAVKLVKLGMRGRWSANPVQTFKNARRGDFWESIKPSALGSTKPVWMTFDDEWVDQVRRGLLACKVFLWMPLYWITYNQMNNNLVSQAATMDLRGLPNDLLNNLNPLSIIIFVPIVDRLIYPNLRRVGIKFTPIKRMFTGFMMGSLAMIVSTVIQYYIYQKNPCGKHANECVDKKLVAPIIVWAQTPAYVIIGFSEIFLNITSLEYAFTKAPKNMRSLVMSVNLFMTALGNAINYALIALAEDPLLVWNYAVAAIIAFIAGIGFWLTHRGTDKQEDALNMLADTRYFGKKSEIDAERAHTPVERADYSSGVPHEQTVNGHA